jgi:hypothetical protein
MLAKHISPFGKSITHEEAIILNHASSFQQAGMDSTGACSLRTRSKRRHFDSRLSTAPDSAMIQVDCPLAAELCRNGVYGLCD